MGLAARLLHGALIVNFKTESGMKDYRTFCSLVVSMTKTHTIAIAIARKLQMSI